MDDLPNKNMQDQPIVPSTIKIEIQLKNKIGYLGLLAQLCTNYCKEFDLILKSNYSLENEDSISQLETKKEFKMSIKRKFESEGCSSVKPKIFDLLKVEDETSPKFICHEKQSKKLRPNPNVSISSRTENCQNINGLLRCNWIANSNQCNFCTYSKDELAAHLITHRNCQLLNDYNLYAEIKNHLTNKILI